MVWPPFLSCDRKWTCVTKCTHSRVVGLPLEGNLVWTKLNLIYCGRLNNVVDEYNTYFWCGNDYLTFCCERVLGVVSTFTLLTGEISVLAGLWWVVLAFVVFCVVLVHELLSLADYCCDCDTFRFIVLLFSVLLIVYFTICSCIVIGFKGTIRIVQHG